MSTDQEDSRSEERRSWERAELLGLLSTSATLAGLCITAVTFMSTLNREVGAVTIVDDMLVLCAAGFLLCTYLIFWALRSKNPTVEARFSRGVDITFLMALSTMTLAGFIMIYTIW